MNTHHLTTSNLIHLNTNLNNQLYIYDTPFNFESNGFVVKSVNNELFMDQLANLNAIAEPVNKLNNTFAMCSEHTSSHYRGISFGCSEAYNDCQRELQSSQREIDMKSSYANFVKELKQIDLITHEVSSNKNSTSIRSVENLSNDLKLIETHINSLKHNEDEAEELVMQSCVLTKSNI